MLFSVDNFCQLQFLYQFLSENIFRRKLNDFNRLRIFLCWSVFGTGHAIHITEHDETSRLRAASGLEDRKLFHVGSMRHELT